MNEQISRDNYWQTSRKLDFASLNSSNRSGPLADCGVEKKKNIKMKETNGEKCFKNEVEQVENVLISNPSPPEDAGRM